HPTTSAQEPTTPTQPPPPHSPTTLLSPTLPPPTSTLFPYTTLFRSVLPQPLRRRRIGEQVVGRNASPRQRRVHDTPGSGPQRHMPDAVAVGEAQQVARLVSAAGRRERDFPARRRLHVAVPRQRDAARRVRRLHQARAVDPPRGAPAPQIRCAGEPAERPLRRRDEPGL